MRLTYRLYQSLPNQRVRLSSIQLSRSAVVLSLLPRDIFLMAPKTPVFLRILFCETLSSRAGVEPREELSSESTKVVADVSELLIAFIKALPERADYKSGCVAKQRGKKGESKVLRY